MIDTGRNRSLFREIQEAGAEIPVIETISFRRRRRFTARSLPSGDYFPEILVRPSSLIIEDGQDEILDFEFSKLSVIVGVENSGIDLGRPLFFSSKFDS